MTTTRVARGLGWFSVGLGLTEIAAPRALARVIGVRHAERHRKAMLALGVRELISGVGILTQPRSPGWVWVRVGGDVVDLALLGSALKSEASNRGRLAAATAAVFGVTLLDVRTGQELGRNAGNGSGRTNERGLAEVNKAITVRRMPEDVYAFWRDFQNLPRFMEHLESVQVLSDQRSRWKAKAPGGGTVQWEAEIVEDRPNELIGWRVAGDADVTQSGTVRFTPAPGGRGTEVRVELRYDPPGGVIGTTIAMLFGEEPGQQVDSDLRHFKQVMETGEVVHSDASVHRGPHPARPSAELM
ncbi:MAG: SRPBCC family protein [Gemmatimonadales bacterium]